jgi:hypothetical protein
LGLVDRVEVLEEIWEEIRQLLHRDLVQLQLLVVAVVVVPLVVLRLGPGFQEDQVAAVQDVGHPSVQAHRGKGFPEVTVVIRLVAVVVVLVDQVCLGMALSLGLVGLE